MSNVISTLVSIIIGKKEGNKRVEVGKIDVPVPTLKDFGIDVEPEKFEEDGRAVYGTDAQNWLYNAILQGATKKARNSLEAGSVSFKAGFDKFADTLEDLCAPAANGGNPEAALAITEFKNEFKKYLAGLGLAARAQDLINAQVASPKALALQPEAIRSKILVRIEGFVEAYEESELMQKSAVVNYLNKLVGACESEEVDLDDL